MLPDGLVVVVKEECETCRMIAPLLADLAGKVDLTVWTQDDPEFPTGVAARHDADLAVSWHHAIETVPTLLRVVDGAEVDRTVGWSRAEWQRITALDGLGEDLPVMRPGCGSLSVDPDRVDELRVRFEGGRLRSRRVELAELEDDIEAMFVRGWTDGLPVVPPTEERVLRMLAGTTRPPDEVVATVPPDLVDVSVEKVAIAAVMAGCLPEYLPWVLTAVEAICTDEFNIHGVLATTMPVGPVIVASGPGTRAIGMNAGVNALGQGNRANLTIGRAVQLVVRNVGGGRPGEVDRATHGNPGKVSFCFAELADAPFGTLAESRGATPGADAITVFAGEGPRCIVDQRSRTPESLATSLASCLRTLHHPKLVLAFDAILVLGPPRPRLRRRWLGSRQVAVRAARPPADPGRRARRRRRRGRRGSAGVGRRVDAAEVPGGRDPAGVRRRRRRAVLGDDRWLGQRRDRQPASDEGGRSVTRYVLDPTGERNVAQRQPLDRPAAIAGLRIGLLDISKPRGDVFLDQLESRLTAAGASVQRYRKPTFTKPAPVDLRHEISTQCDLVIEALAD
jgi:hypothetical protein